MSPYLALCGRTNSLLLRRLLKRCPHPQDPAGYDSVLGVAAMRYQSTKSGGGSGFRTQAEGKGGARNDNAKTTNTSVANPYKSWEHMNHKWMILMCFGCLGGGFLAGHYAQVDEEALNIPKFEKSTIMDEMRRNFDVRPDLAPTLVRAAFVLAARRAGVQAETIEESCAVPAGMHDLSAVLNFSAIGSAACSMEDLVSLASIEALRFLRGPVDAIVWLWGRRDSDKPHPRVTRLADNNSNSTPTDGNEPPKGLVAAPREYHGQSAQKAVLPFTAVLKAISQDFSDAEMVALMGAHSVGEFHEDVSGYVGAQHTPTRHILDNRHFQVLLDAERRMVPVDVPRSKGNEDVRRLPTNLYAVTVDGSKIPGGGPEAHQSTNSKAKKKKHACAFSGNEISAMLGTPSYRKWVVAFAQDYDLWATHFQSAFGKLINSHPNGKLRPYVSPSAPSSASAPSADEPSAAAEQGSDT